MPRLASILAIAFAIGMAGVALNLTPLGLDFEENVGLNILFHLRGLRNAPSEILIAAFDEESAKSLSLPPLPRKWPRHLFARLVENLAQAGAAVIAFDIHFGDAHSPQEDEEVAEAIRKAKNVVLCEFLRREVIPTDTGGDPESALFIEQTVPPIAPLANAALGLGSFPLPKSPIRLSQFWTFKTEVGGLPTLPVVAFQVFALDVYAPFVQLLENTKIGDTPVLPTGQQAMAGSGTLNRFLLETRDFFEKHRSLLAEKLDEQLPFCLASVSDPKQKRVLKSLVKLYQSPESLFLDFYGPPRTITTVPLHKILRTNGEAGNQFDLRGKAIFIGLSEVFQTGQQDSFHTVFSQPDGTDLSGVEVAATAFGNLLEDRSILPLASWERLLIVFFWGVLIGSLCLLVPPLFSAAGGALIGLGYLVIAQNQFTSSATWLPLAVPLLVQGPLAFLCGLSLRYAAAERARRRTRKVFEFYLPAKVIEQIITDSQGVETSSQTVLGTVLCSDAARYTALSEKMSPRELNIFLNKYFEMIFEAVKRYEGMVSDIIGDSMLAVWTSSNPSATPQKSACLATLEMARSLDEFYKLSRPKFHTRFGLHCGPLLLGHIGGPDRYEYRPIGDVVNTAVRMQNLNKRFGTRILASAEVLGETSEFLRRELGQFLLAGKQKPVKLFELIGLSEEADERDIKRCAVFAEGVHLFQSRAWEEASSLFMEYLKIVQLDKACLLYLDLCRSYQDNPPDWQWDGVISPGKK